jgi:hypothetical protein
MQTIKNKSYEEILVEEFDFISFNSKGTLSIVMKSGTHYNFRGDELKIIKQFIMGLE